MCVYVCLHIDTALLLSFFFLFCFTLRAREAAVRAETALEWETRLVKAVLLTRGLPAGIAPGGISSGTPSSAPSGMARGLPAGIAPGGIRSGVPSGIAPAGGALSCIKRGGAPSGTPSGTPHGIPSGSAPSCMERGDSSFYGTGAFQPGGAPPGMGPAGGAHPGIASCGTCSHGTGAFQPGGYEYRGGAHSCIASGGTCSHGTASFQPGSYLAHPSPGFDYGSPKVYQDGLFTPERHLPPPGQRGDTHQRHTAAGTATLGSPASGGGVNGTGAVNRSGAFVHSPHGSQGGSPGVYLGSPCSGGAVNETGAVNRSGSFVRLEVNSAPAQLARGRASGGGSARTVRFETHNSELSPVSPGA